MDYCGYFDGLLDDMEACVDDGFDDEEYPVLFEESFDPDEDYRTESNDYS
jgi:hypothetical protein